MLLNKITLLVYFFLYLTGTHVIKESRFYLLEMCLGQRL